MSKHQLVQSQITVTNKELSSHKSDDKEFNEYLKLQLASGLVAEIIKNDITSLDMTDILKHDSKQLRLSVVVINRDDYLKLLDIVTENNFRVMKDGKEINLLDLL